MSIRDIVSGADKQGQDSENPLDSLMGQLDDKSGVQEEYGEFEVQQQPEDAASQDAYTQLHTLEQTEKKQGKSGQQSQDELQLANEPPENASQRAEREEAEAQRMVDELLALEQAWASAGDGTDPAQSNMAHTAEEMQKWIDEMTAMDAAAAGDTVIPPEMMRKAWEQAVQDTLARTDDPRFHQSQFFDFIKQLSSGNLGFANADGVQSLVDLNDEQLNEMWEQDMLNAGISPYSQYDFVADNAFQDQQADVEELLQVAIDLFDRGDPAALLAFEAVVQRAPHHSRAWRLLGLANAENDEDDKAISALKRSVEVDPTNLESLMALATGHVNNGDINLALKALHNWMAVNVEYQDVVASHQGEPTDLDSVINMYLDAARSKPDNPDADVQIGLGLLFCLFSEYDKASDCFRVAVAQRPDDYALINKLAATLANSNQNEEAIEKYHRALELKPSYTRARANIGISYSNEGKHQEASAYFLSALSVNPDAEHLWNNLAFSLVGMKRGDLVRHVQQRNVEAFREFFDF